ncbi:hypothetical protein V6N12_025640 [Hibiscus sabdariffa]|uniref:Putative plant transposon protein domain-containing protein n=1 Tax=Hibiscus sabdariffa TaxID=183260 RepID=A0ABR2CJ01_9ROSI
MATSSSSTEGLPSRFRNAAARARYNNVVAAKNKWEEQGFLFDDHLENYGLEPLIYKRLSDLGSLRFGRQAAQANLSWVRKFYAHNPVNSATINTLLDLPEDLPSIYALTDALEDEDLNLIKDQICLPNTTWNITGKNPGTNSLPQLLPEAKLCNTFVKRNLMPTSHNQTMDRTRLVLINAIIISFKFNVGEVIGRELSDACQNDKGILAFPCIISALCRRATVSNRPSDKYTRPKSGWTQWEYMHKMDLTDATPIQVAMPTPPTSHQSQAETPAPSPVDVQNDTPATTPMDNPAHTPEAPANFASTPATPPSPPAANPQSPAPTVDTPPLHILQLHNQLQRVETRQLQLIEETKVFQNSLISFLCFQFPHAANFFRTQPTTAPPLAAASTADPSVEDGQTEPINLSEEDIFDWQTPIIALATITALARADDVVESSHARKRKMPAGRTIQTDTPSDAADKSKEATECPSPQSPAKRRRRYHIVSSYSDDDGNADPASSKSLAF